MDIRINANRVRSLRKRTLMTQEELAGACGLHARTLQRIESTGIASARAVKTIAQALGIDPAELELDEQANGASSLRQETIAFVKRAFGIALLWVALASIVFVPTSEGGGVATVVAVSGFICFAIAYWCLRVDDIR